VRLHVVRKLALAVVLLVVLANRPAHADCHGSPCPQWLNVVGYTFLAGVTTGYAYGTGRFIYSDVNDPDQSLNYGVTELTANGLLATLFTAGTIDAARNHSASVLVWGGMTALHTTLAVHGGWRIYQERSGFILPKAPIAWIGGSLYGVNAAYWLTELQGPHSRAFGITEAAVNAPIAIGLGYLAYDRFHTFRGGPGLLYGGMAAVSAAFVVDGLRTVIAPRKGNKLDLLPTYDDGPGLSFAGSW